MSWHSIQAELALQQPGAATRKAAAAQGPSPRVSGQPDEAALERQLAKVPAASGRARQRAVERQILDREVQQAKARESSVSSMATTFSCVSVNKGHHAGLRAVEPWVELV